MSLIYLAPMEGVVDYTLRDILTASGHVDHCVTEFIRVSERLLPVSVFYRMMPELHHGGKTRSGVPVFAQLLGSEPSVLAENAARVVELGAPGVDLNFGCPAKTVNKSRGGAVLLKEPELIHSIVNAVRAAIPSAIPVTAKMRLGYYDKSLAIENAQAIESAGASTLTIHARTKEEGYKPPAHWEWIAKIRDHVSLHLVANGEVWTPEDYRRCKQVSGCADVMIGRGMLANPFLADQIKQGEGVSAASDEKWIALIPLLERYHQQVIDDLSERHVHGRIKQWLSMLKLGYPQASVLFDRIRSERDPLRIMECIRAERECYSVPAE
ncbi:tRNA dihydrouridine synthase [Nitrincola tibetensis]|nr:tRNA-dihydrouridine synthase [Nitrincola tibetensis]